uniref:Nudix hydrolase 20, chloroplastic isoform X4 n=1 Tax=Elaeis guineensis var. tenera TaxID=51953 RepID=A0A8N4IED2_ELAGV|nr:nudix hydrolase 20, chloroplastic isoform X4 [Elaeis guineensis]
MACYRFPATIVAPRASRHRIRAQKPSISHPKRLFSAASSARFGWDDVLRVGEGNQEDDDPSDLRGYFEKVWACNRGSEKQSEFVPFLVEDQIVGYIHKGLHSSLKKPDDRTRAVGHVIKCIGKLIPGIRNELYPVTSSFGMPIFFSLERAAAPYFGIKAYGVHMNGYVERDGQQFLWLGKRSNMKPTFPGMLDHLVAGGLPHGITCKENLMKECEEEAGIPRSISNNAISVGAISYIDIDKYKYKRDVLFCYDLKLPAGFIPKNEGVCFECTSFADGNFPHVLVIPQIGCW